MTEVVQPKAGEQAASQQFRSQVGHISRQSGIYFAGTILSAALGYLFKIYLARTLGAEALGIFALGMTLVGLIGVFNSLGLAEAAVRFSAVYRATGKVGPMRSLLYRGGVTLLAANAVFFLVFLVVGGPVARRFYHSPKLANYIPWFAMLMILGVVSNFYGKILAGYHAVGPRTIITKFVGTPAGMLFSVVLITLGYGLRGYLLAQVVAAVLVGLLLLGAVWRRTPPESRIVRPWPERLEPQVWSFSVAAISNLVLEFVSGQTDKIALGFYLGSVQVGIYSVAMAMVTYLSLILTSVNQVFSPVIADLHAKADHAMLGRLYAALANWILRLTLPLIIVVTVYAAPLMRIFGRDFESGWPILVIGAGGQLVNCAVGSVGLLLWMSGNQKLLLRVQVIMVAFMVIACAALIPVWGMIGAAVAAALTNAGMNIGNLAVVHKVFGFSPFNSSFRRLLLPTIAGLVASLWIRHQPGILGRDWLNALVSLGVLYTIFSGMALAAGLEPDDRLIAAAIWSRLRRLLPN
jgi:O-antigen/teichoic acid export membrane protein